MLAAPAAMAAPILIDDFTVDQVAGAGFAGGPADSIGSPSLKTGIGPLNLSRTFEVINTTPSPIPGESNDGSVLRSTGSLGGFPPPNTLTLNNGNLQTSIASVIYDGRTDVNTPLPLVPTIDLVGTGNNAFFFELPTTFTPNLNGTTFVTTVTDLDSSATFTEELDVTFNPLTLFSSFAGIDFTQVRSLQFTFNTNELAGFQGELASISAVPLPASILLLLGGLGGLVGVSSVSKRRRKA